MSIQLTMKVDALERQVIALQERVAELEKLEARLALIEQTAMRKPGPKPKDSNG